MKDKQKDDITTVNSLELDMSLIDEDPNQPRTEFDPVTLQELADTIRRRGVKTPISVRPNPESEGRFIINHGARRFRASKLAGKKTIPAFIDIDYSKVDQVIENIQRDSLTPREIAEFFAYQSSQGFSQVAIGKMIGKSKSFVSQYSTLINLPSSINELLDSGKVRDVTIISNLAIAYKQSPEITIDWIGSGHEITRGSVDILRRFIKAENRKIKKGLAVPITSTGTQINKTSQLKYHYSNNELLSLFTKFQQSMVLKEDFSHKALDRLTKGERESLTSILHKLVDSEES